MKMYNEEGLELMVDKDQMNILIEAGYSLTKPGISEPSEEVEIKVSPKQVSKPLKKKIAIKKI
jgi:hypothetical protein